VIEIDLEPLTPRVVPLAPRVERGRSDDVGPAVGPVSVGGPISIPLTKESAPDDPDLAAFVDADSDHRYDLVHLAGTFAPVDEPLQRVWFIVQLARPDKGPSPLPIAWSMKPERLSDDVTNSSKATIGADAKLLSAGLELGSSRVSKDVSLQALYTMQSNPTWILERTKSAEISGTQRFVLVVRSPRDAPAHGRLEVGALIRKKRLGLLSYKVPLDAIPDPLEFQVAG
jgi:hypothetical protein